ncbi:hypothetical protein BSL84_30475 [Streptomyces sp. TN58]|nr:hypothetical protein BSL84_30475 [Streptomyces sp. TN58]
MLFEDQEKLPLQISGPRGEVWELRDGLVALHQVGVESTPVLVSVGADPAGTFVARELLGPVFLGDTVVV